MFIVIIFVDFFLFINGKKVMIVIVVDDDYLLCPLSMCVVILGCVMNGKSHSKTKQNKKKL